MLLQATPRLRFPMKRLTWWHCGLFGLIVLLAATLIGAPLKIILYIFRYPGTDIPWRDLPLFCLAIASMGFTCGVVGWFVWLLARRLGAIGDAMIGIVVMVFFFFLCMLIFDRSLLVPDPSKGLPMWILAIVFGIMLGVWCGRDFRKLAREQQPQKEQTEQSNQSDETPSRR